MYFVSPWYFPWTLSCSHNYYYVGNSAHVYGLWFKWLYYYIYRQRKSILRIDGNIFTCWRLFNTTTLHEARDKHFVCCCTFLINHTIGCFLYRQRRIAMFALLYEFFSTWFIAVFEKNMCVAYIYIIRLFPIMRFYITYYNNWLCIVCNIYTFYLCLIQR